MNQQLIFWLHLRCRHLRHGHRYILFLLVPRHLCLVHVCFGCWIINSKMTLYLMTHSRLSELKDMKSYYKSSSVCLSVCLFVPLLLRGPLKDLRQAWWVYIGGPRNFPWKVLFWKGQWVNGLNVTFSEQTTPGWDHTTAKGMPSKRRTVSKSLIPWTDIITCL